MENMHPNREKKLGTVLVILLGLLILYLIFEQQWLLYFVLGIGVFSLLFDQFLSLVNRLWYGLAHILGNYVTTPIILALIFFLILWPIAMMWRFFNRDNLQLKKKGGSYYRTRNHSFKSEDLEKMW